jgi:hypothetical protein
MWYKNNLKVIRVAQNNNLIHASQPHLRWLASHPRGGQGWPNSRVAHRPPHGTRVVAAHPQDTSRAVFLLLLLLFFIFN